MTRSAAFQLNFRVLFCISFLLLPPPAGIVQCSMRALACMRMTRTTLPIRPTQLLAPKVGRLDTVFFKKGLFYYVIRFAVHVLLVIFLAGLRGSSDPVLCLRLCCDCAEWAEPAAMSTTHL